ncbi:bi-domain-containing oxidoreductase [Maribellus maritimus]|uniref:bi-domain-containing oxidoreductase n=1 Tax=Maribellus maritimus TaxID=2870838 RepID=UPI001EEB35EB|nr:bi-domain-containing oxidoreductase [Maribellus maritimus]MCG6188143.1 bi-domain-containing oxidoreductase [Maribellus maritimus]
MLQAIVKKGKVLAEKVPAPLVRKGGILIKVVNSCISAGTEMSNVDITKKSLVRLALEQPENVKTGLKMIKETGIKKTFSRITGMREGGKPTGYSISGIVLAVDEEVTDFKPGDRVAAAGAGLANHAEFVDVPKNLVMKIPDSLDFEKASTVTLGGIAIQGVRRADLRFGEFGVVVGAGILGLLTVQLLQLSGIRVIAVDIDEKRLAIAKELGAELIINPSKEDQVKLITNYTGGKGTDAVIFTAATSSSHPLSEAFKSCKRKGKVVLVGVSGMEIKRSDIYSKELDFLISSSYGPGRYDAEYEEKGHDYPYAYVRWTENRNMTEYLRLLSEHKIVLDKIIQHKFGIQNVTEAFQLLNNSEQRPLMVILDYGSIDSDQIVSLTQHSRKINIKAVPVLREKINVALVGAGSFATAMHLPNMKMLDNKFQLIAVVNRTGHKATAVAKQFGAAYSTTNINDILSDDSIDLVIICTRHGEHAQLTLDALKAGKHVFVEKPLATNQKDLKSLQDFYDRDGEKPLLMVGFNRRFSKYAQEIKQHTQKRINPLFIHYRMNAGYIPLDHWVHEEGGRIVGEACHLIDLMTFFTESKIKSISVEELTPTNGAVSSSDNKSIVLKYQDGSVCTIEYFAVGNKSLPKEYMEIHFDEKSIVMEDYKQLKGYGIKINEIRTSGSEKGQLEELKALFESLTEKDKNWPIEWWDMVQTTEISLAIQQ